MPIISTLIKEDMAKIWAFIRHNSGIVIGCVLAVLVLIWAYGCQSKVVSIVNSPTLVTRAELELEVDHFLKNAEIRFAELDWQDEFKRTVFAIAIEFMQGGQINPVGVAMTIASILGVAALGDNIRKRTYINTLKGNNANKTTTT